MKASTNSAVRAIDIAIGYVEREELRLRALIESELTSSEEKFQALKDLAYLSGIVVRELADMRVHSEETGSLAEDRTASRAEEAQRRIARAAEEAREGPPEQDAKAIGLTSLHKDVCDNLSEGVYFVDKERKITYWNGGAEHLTGFGREEAIGRHCFNNFLRHVDDDGRLLCHTGCPLSFTLQDGKAREAEIFLHNKAGQKVPVAVRVSPVVDKSGALIGAVEVFSNIAPQKALERRASELEALAYVDSLTALSSRRHIELKLRQALEEVEQFGRKAGVILLDLDGFKKINDAYGHSGGDEVLKAVGSKLLETLRPRDSAGRWGGEEFLLVAMDVSLAKLEAIAERCRDGIASCRIPLDGGAVSVTASVGVSLLKKGMTAELAIKHADKMLYMAKRQGGNAVKARR